MIATKAFAKRIAGLRSRCEREGYNGTAGDQLRREVAAWVSVCRRVATLAERDLVAGDLDSATETVRTSSRFTLADVLAATT